MGRAHVVALRHRASPVRDVGAGHRIRDAVHEFGPREEGFLLGLGGGSTELAEALARGGRTLKLVESVILYCWLHVLNFQL